MVPGSAELPLLHNTVEGSGEFNEGLAAWWERCRHAFQFAYENQLIGGIKDDVRAVETEVTEVKTSISEVAGSAGSLGGDGGMPSTITTAGWDGGEVAQSSWKTRADGGMAGPMIFAMDGGSPDSDFSFAVRPELNGVDQTSILDLIEGTHTGGTP